MEYTSFPLTGTPFDKYLRKLFLNKNRKLIVTRRSKYSTGQHYSAVDQYPLPNHKEVYQEVEALLDKFYEEYRQEELYYKGVNVPKVIRRSSHNFLTELFNSVAQVKAFHEQYKEVKIVADNKICTMLRHHNITCTPSPILSVWYFLFEIALKVRRKLKNISKEGLNQDIYFADSGKKLNILSIGVSVDRNKTFVNISNHLKGKFNTMFIHQETKGEVVLEEFKKRKIEFSHKKHEIIKDKIILSAGKIKHIGNPVFKYLQQKINQELTASIKDIIIFVDLLDNIHSKEKIDAVLTGLTFGWLYDLTIQWAKFNNVINIFAQDVFFNEDLYHNISADYVITGSKQFRLDLIEMGYSEENIKYTSQINDLLTQSPLKLSNINIIKSREYISKVLADRGVDLGQKKIIYIASDPGDYLNTPYQKYRSEKIIFEEASELKDYVVILKLHHSDIGEISRKALKDSSAENGLIIKDVDFYKGLAAADVFISKYSTSVIEAMIMGKFILLMNHEGGNFYQKAVVKKVAYFLNKKGDLKKMMGKKDELISDFDYKVKNYISNTYYSEDDTTSEPVVEIINQIMQNGW